MPKTILKALLVLSLALPAVSAAPAWAGDTLDSIVATVNGHIILQSDWDDELRYESFISGQGRGHQDNNEQKAALDRLIDQELLTEQMQITQVPSVPESEVAQRLSDVRKLYAGAEKDEVWQSLLKQSGITEAGLRSRLEAQIRLNHLVDVRLRPSINIDSTSIESYYNEELLPRLRSAGAKQVPLAEVTPEIKQVLTEQKLNQLLVAWLQTLRTSSTIRSETISDPAGLQQPK